MIHYKEVLYIPASQLLKRMAKSNQPCEVFISFCFEEFSIAEALQALIEGFHYSAFIACPQRIRGDWLERIESQVKSAKAVVLMLSNVSVRKPWVSFETGAAWIRKGKNSFVPVKYNLTTKLPDPMPRCD